MALNSLYKTRTGFPTQMDPTSLKGQQAARRKRERELNRQQEAAQKEQDLRAINAYERAKHAEAAQQLACQLLVVRANAERGISGADAAKAEHIVENARRSFRPTAEQRTFDPYQALDEALAHVRPKGEHIRRNQTSLTREQRITENESYAQKLKRLGLTDPRVGVIGSGSSGLGQ